VTETNPGSEFDLDMLVVKAAEDLGITATLEAPGGSDQEPFRDPASFGIDDATPVESSALLDSYPLFYSNKWDMGTPGWIHTSYDNSTSTTTLNWVEADDLGNHIRVAALSVMRIVIYLRGDINGDHAVDINDLDKAAAAFGATPSDSDWDPTADLVKDDLIDIFDVVLIAIDYGKSY